VYLGLGLSYLQCIHYVVLGYLLATDEFAVETQAESEPLTRCLTLHFLGRSRRERRQRCASSNIPLSNFATKGLAIVFNLLSHLCNDSVHHMLIFQSFKSREAGS